MNIRTTKTQWVTALTAVAILSGTVGLLKAADAKPKYTIKEVMEALHKGKENIAKTAAAGNGTKADFDKMVDYYSALPANTPEKGSAESWKEKTTKLLDAAKELQAGKPDAVAHYKEASNCKACHTEHQVKKPKP
ncbi:MAG: hypothetical protein JWN25_3210 [Verrucomicrobiales bacterium]|nr:hypothetical protein [Verrucomicrobiales bacterium]